MPYNWSITYFILYRQNFKGKINAQFAAVNVFTKKNDSKKVIICLSTPGKDLVVDFGLPTFILCLFENEADEETEV